MNTTERQLLFRVAIVDVEHAGTFTRLYSRDSISVSTTEELDIQTVVISLLHY